MATQDITSLRAAGDVLYKKCLARMVQPDGTVLPISEFVSCLSIPGAGHDLDDHVTRLVLGLLEQMPDAVLGYQISADSFTKPKLWATILEKLSAHQGLAPRMVLEIAETQPIGDLFQAREILDEARRLGCRIAIDDFGAGYLAPSALLLLDADIIKIDAALLRDIRPGTGGRDSFQHIVGFASCMAPVVVAQGVEQRRQMDLARIAGATHVQSLLVSDPASVQLLKLRSAQPAEVC